MNKSFYITTTLPYVNAEPHIGFALEIIQADVVARYQRLLGKDVIFNTGTDEHGVKIYRKAQEEDIDVQKYVDGYAAKFGDLKSLLNVSYTNFIRTTNKHHKLAAQEMWRLCDANGYIYKKQYQVKYCVGCELEKTDSELEHGVCPIHPTYEIELIDEENYFFKFSEFQDKLLELYSKPGFIIPEHKNNEIKAFVERGLQDFSISRLKSKMPWGIEVPGDDDQVMYVWFDALTNYISTLGWPNVSEGFKKLWPGVQVAGKDNLRQQTAIWQAMLMAAGLDPSKQVFIHGFITSEGQKMSKSIGNVVNPKEIVKEYGVDAVRYYLLGALPSYDDGDFSKERFEEFYTAHLSNGVGNLTSRILTMVQKYGDSKLITKNNTELFDVKKFWSDYDKHIKDFNFEKLVEHINNLVTLCDSTISEQKPWEQAKAGKDVSSLLYQLTETLRHIGFAMLPIIPQAATKMLAMLGYDKHEVKKNKYLLQENAVWGIIKRNTEYLKGDALFPRLEK